MKFEVVIAGGGFAGAHCARQLGKLLGESGRERVALIAERNVLVFQPMLAEVVGSALTATDVVNPLREYCRHVTVLQGSIHRVDWEKRQMVVDGGRFTRNHEIGFRHLVLALGSKTDLSRVPGLADYGWPMKTVADALRLRAAVINRLEEANLVEDDEVRRRLMTFVVAGGGYTGVETAGQIHTLLHEMRDLYTNLGGHPIRVVLVHSHEHLLEEIGDKLGDYAQGVLERRGLEIRLNRRVSEVTAQKVILDDGSYIDAHTVISTVGNAPHPVVLDLCKQIGLSTDHGRVPTDATMRVQGQNELWAVGDCASVPWNDRGQIKRSPPTAQFAQRQGQQLGKNLANALRGQPVQPFRYRYMGQMATVGEREAVAEIFGLHFSGFFAWWLWRTVYLAKLPGFARKLRVMIDWTFDLIFPRDISVLLPPPDDLLRSIHMEKGEKLTEIGDTCRAYFFVRRGSLSAEGSPERSIASDGVIDQQYVDETGCWNTTWIANESTDLTAFRGRALELFRSRLRLVARNESEEPLRLPG